MLFAAMRWSLMAQSGQSSCARVCPLLDAGSTGRCNTGVKSLRRGFELQGLTWPFVELTRHFIQMGLRVHRQVGSLRKVLSQQTFWKLAVISSLGNWRSIPRLYLGDL